MLVQPYPGPDLLSLWCYSFISSTRSSCCSYVELFLAEIKIPRTSYSVQIAEKVLPILFSSTNYRTTTMTCTHDFLIRREWRKGGGYRYQRGARSALGSHSHGSVASAVEPVTVEEDGKSLRNPHWVCERGTLAWPSGHSEGS